VNFEGALPLGWKWPLRGTPGACAAALPLSASMAPTTANGVPAAGRLFRKSLLLIMGLSGLSLGLAGSVGLVGGGLSSI
jgi:hypothetical protein